MTQQVTQIFKIRPENGWVNVGVMPDVMSINPAVRHPWFMTFDIATPTIPFADAIHMGTEKHLVKHEFVYDIGGGSTGSNCYIAIENPPSSDPHTTMNFTVVKITA